MTNLRSVARRVPGLRWAALKAGQRLPLGLHARVRPEPADLVRRVISSGSTFVQIGANDGQAGDPLFGTVTTAECRGIVIEPVPAIFERLKETYRPFPHITPVQAAVTSSEADVVTLFAVRRRDLDPEWADQLNSFRRDVILRHVHLFPEIEERIEEIQVPGRRLGDLIREHALEPLTLLHVDTEGYDYEILLEMAGSKVRPQFILYEHIHLDVDSERARALLMSLGYGVAELRNDTWAWRQGRA